MNMRIAVAFTPYDVKRLKPSGLCVVVDVLRASSTIVTALRNGCPAIYPISEPSEAFPFADGSDVLACGEKNGMKIRGYHLGNSPAEFSRETVAGRRMVMCTTNGTRAIRAGAVYPGQYIGCLLNAPAVAACLKKHRDDVTVICAGREGDFSIEDTLCAGMIVSELDGKMSDAAVASVAVLETYQDRIEEVLFESEHGRFLQKIGFADDIAYCSRVGITDIVPEVVRSEKPAPHDLVIKAATDIERSRGGKQ